MSTDEDVRKMKAPSWNPDVVSCLLDIYSEKFFLGRGYLRNKDWEEVMNRVNDCCEGTEFVKTVKQCKHKIDSLKRRYKTEKRKAVLEGYAALEWPHFQKMDRIMRSMIKIGGVMDYHASSHPLQNQASGDEKLECSDSPHVFEGDSCGNDRDHESWENAKNKERFSHPGKLRKPFAAQEFTDVSSEPKAAFKMMDSPVSDSPKKRKAESGNPIQSLMDAVMGFSDLYTRIEIAKMEILRNMKVQIANMERKRRKRHISCPSSSETD